MLVNTWGVDVHHLQVFFGFNTHHLMARGLRFARCDGEFLPQNTVQ
jgi:hypothetical protein